MPLDAAGPSLARCDLLGMADLLVMSDGTPEIHPRVLLEALALAVPVIGPGVPGVGEVVADELSGFIADAASQESIERALRRWHADASLRASFGVRAGVQARRLMDTSRLIERHVALLREAVLAGS
jgi:glycosyltransferase involved in cell wall biosynthesis